MPVTVFAIDRASLTSPTNTTTLITGGSSGIGLATALLLHSLPGETNNVVLLDRNPPSSAASAVPPAPASFVDSPRVLYVHCDVTSWRSQRAAFAHAAAHFGSIDHVFVNAGVAEYRDQFFKDERDETGELAEPDRRTLTVDLDSAADTVKLAIWHLRRNNNNGKGEGSIVLTASLAGYLASAGAPLYSAAKHGVVGLMRALKNDLATLNLAISVVGPGITLTNIVSGREPGQTLTEWAGKMRAAGVPINEPDDVAAAVVWLIGQGTKANGAGLLIQAGKCADVEAGLARGRGAWMGEEMLRLFRGGRLAPLFPNKL